MSQKFLYQFSWGPFSAGGAFTCRTAKHLLMSAQGQGCEMEPLKGQRSDFYGTLCFRGEEQSSQCQPRPFYSRHFVNPPPSPPLPPTPSHPFCYHKTYLQEGLAEPEELVQPVRVQSVRLEPYHFLRYMPNIN